MRNLEFSDSLFARECLGEHLAAFLAELSTLKGRSHRDSVHSTRVRSRRTREALEAFQDLFPAVLWHEIHDQVRWVTSELGKLREREVSLALLGELTRGGDMAENLCREFLAQRFLRRQRETQRALEALLNKVAIPHLRAQSQRLLGQRLPAVPAAGGREPASARPPARAPRTRPAQPTLFEVHPRALERAARIIATRSVPILEFIAERRFRRASDEHLHALRIAAKKLRYSLEIFDRVWHGGLRGQIGQARAVQDSIGRYHDWCVLSNRIGREIRRTTRDDASHMAFQLGRLLSEVRERKIPLRKEILPKLRDLEAGLRLLSSPFVAGRSEVARTRR